MLLYTTFKIIITVKIVNRGEKEMDIAIILLLIGYIAVTIITIILEIKNDKMIKENLKMEIKLINKQEKISWILIEADLNKENPAVTVKKIKEVITSD